MTVESKRINSDAEEDHISSKDIVVEGDLQEQQPLLKDEAEKKE